MVQLTTRYNCTKLHQIAWNAFTLTESKSHQTCSDGDEPTCVCTCKLGRHNTTVGADHEFLPSSLVYEYFFFSCFSESTSQECIQKSWSSFLTACPSHPPNPVGSCVQHPSSLMKPCWTHPPRCQRHCQRSSSRSCSHPWQHP